MRLKTNTFLYEWMKLEKRMIFVEYNFQLEVLGFLWNDLKLVYHYFHVEWASNFIGIFTNSKKFSHLDFEKIYDNKPYFYVLVHIVKCQSVGFNAISMIFITVMLHEKVAISMALKNVKKD